MRIQGLAYEDDIRAHYVTFRKQMRDARKVCVQVLFFVPIKSLCNADGYREQSRVEFKWTLSALAMIEILISLNVSVLFV